MNPIHKFNGGKGATLCNECRVIIHEKLTNTLFCNKCIMKIKTVDKQTLINNIVELLEDMSVPQLIKLIENITEEEE